MTGNEGLNGHWRLTGHPLDDVIGFCEYPVPIVHHHFAQVLNHEGWELEIFFHPEPKLVDFQWNVAHLETKNFSDSGRDLIVVHLYWPMERVDLVGMRGRIGEQSRDEPPLILPKIAVLLAQN
jgi:hypothetical protein